MKNRHLDDHRATTPDRSTTTGEPVKQRDGQKAQRGKWAKFTIAICVDFQQKIDT
jgi:hypothetical protein